jgi:Protein of unknown function (DUF3667)
VTEAAPDAGIRPGPVAVLAPAEPPPSVPLGPRVCLDCGAVLNGKFCSVCGQKDEPLKRGLRELALEFFQHPLIDTKLWRSLRPLLLRPGVLTVEYLAGRRTRYVRPLKLYLTVSVVFFALLALRVSPDTWVKFDVQPDKVVGQDASQPTNSPHLPIHWLDERWQRNMAALEGPDAKATQTAVASRMAGNIPKMIFLLLPLSAVLFKLFWWRRYFVEHLVFTLHLHSYVFAVGLVRFLHWTPVTFVILGWSCGYLPLAFKRVYGDGWPKTVAKLLGVALSYAVLLAAALLLTGLVAVLAA